MILFIEKFIGIFSLTMLADICWTKYLIHVQKRNALKAALWSASIVICSSVTILSYVSDKRFIAASILGSFTGTYLTVKRTKE